MKDEIFLPKCFGHHDSAWPGNEGLSATTEEGPCENCRLENFCKDRTIVSSLLEPAEAVLMYLFEEYKKTPFEDRKQQHCAIMNLAMGFGYAGSRTAIHSKLQNKIEEIYAKGHSPFFTEPATRDAPESLGDYALPEWMKKA